MSHHQILESYLGRTCPPSPVVWEQVAAGYWVGRVGAVTWRLSYDAARAHGVLLCAAQRQRPLRFVAAERYGQLAEVVAGLRSVAEHISRSPAALARHLALHDAQMHAEVAAYRSAT